MKKTKIISIIFILFLITFLTACGQSIPAQQGTQPVGEIKTPQSQQPVIQATAPTPSVTSNKVEMLIGINNQNYNNNKEGLSKSLINFAYVGREPANLENEKYYFEGLWDVREDYAKTGSYKTNFVVKTTAKSISIQAESENYAVIKVFKGERYLPDSEVGSSVSKTIDGFYGFKMLGQGTFNLVKRSENTPTLYNIEIDRAGVSFYKLILEY